MSNRIDLTQFEGISPAKEWGLVYPERPQRSGVWTGDGLYHPHCRADDIEVRRANVALMAAAPDLLAELKRCYDLIDAQKENIEFFGGVVEKIHEERWADAVERFVEEHHPSKWCDYTYCSLCDEETASQ